MGLAKVPLKPQSVLFFLLLFPVFLLLSVYLAAFIKQLLSLAESSVADNRVTFVGPLPLERYSIQNLKNRPFSGSNFTLEKVFRREDDFTAYIFSFKTSGKKVTGLANIPHGLGPFPLILMVRGYVDRKVYTTGAGTSRVGSVFASRGFITLAPDFLGYGGSDNPSPEPLEERFQTYTTLLDLFGLVSATHNGNCQMSNVKCDLVSLWSHSNGGQIALTFLEVTGRNISTVLWAPVSKPFPYSILYFTDEAEDRGKALRKVVADFEKHYDADKYSLTSYFADINAPILLQQGTEDEAVPKSWSDELNKRLELLGKKIIYEVYERADHNLLGSWAAAVQKDLEFFNSH